jgi:hypothetical protein
MTPTSRPQHRVAGPRVIVTGILIVILITGFVVLRVLTNPRSASAPESIPETGSREGSEAEITVENST